MTSLGSVGQFGQNPRVRIARIVGGDVWERVNDSDRRRIRWRIVPDRAGSSSDLRTATNAWRALGVQVGDAHPEDPLLRATEFRVQQSREHRHGWEVEWTYEPVGGGLDVDPTEPGYVEVNVDNEVEFQDFFVQDATLPSQGQPSLPPPVITDGESIAVDGRPTSLPVRTIRADISVVIEGWPDFPAYATATGRRNNVTFQGGAVGSVLYTGARSNRIESNVWRVVHSFVQDQFFHCRQIGRFDSDGELLEALWVQPFREFANFDLALGLPPLTPP